MDEQSIEVDEVLDGDEISEIVGTPKGKGESKDPKSYIILRKTVNPKLGRSELKIVTQFFGTESPSTLGKILVALCRGLTARYNGKDFKLTVK